MSLDLLDGPSEADIEYQAGYDDGYEGRSRRSESPAYLEGYYDGQRDAEDADWDDQGYDFIDFDDERDW